jgi:hypothetical protein
MFGIGWTSSNYEEEYMQCPFLHPIRLDEFQRCRLFLYPCHRVLILFCLRSIPTSMRVCIYSEPRMVGKLCVPLYRGSRTHMGASSSYPSARP